VRQVTATTTQTIPSEAPKAKVTVNMVTKDEQGNQLSCLNADVTINRKFEVEDLAAMPAITPALVATVNMAQTTWRAHHSPRVRLDRLWSTRG
jgi:hypothetical protein